jgi:hypothetical protein
VPISRENLLKYFNKFYEILDDLIYKYPSLTSESDEFIKSLNELIKNIRYKLNTIDTLESGREKEVGNVTFSSENGTNYLTKEEIPSYYQQTMDALKEGIRNILPKAIDMKNKLAGFFFSKLSKGYTTKKRVALYDKFILLANNLLEGKPYDEINQSGAARRRRKASRRYKKTGGKKRGSRRTRRCR